jgi:hypothetical protein
MRYVALILIITALSLTGCFNPDYGDADTPYLCSDPDPANSTKPEDRTCPEGFFCHFFSDNAVGKQYICVKELPDDLGIPDRKLLTDAELVPKKEGPVFLDQALVLPTTPACSDHSSEPNNTAATATELISEGLITGWEICYMFDIDQYKITIQDAKVGQTLTIKVEFSHDNDGDIDAALIDPEGQTISVSRSESNNEQVSTATNGTIKGDYILGVWSSCCDRTTSKNTSGAAIKYNLNISIN